MKTRKDVDKQPPPVEAIAETGVQGNPEHARRASQNG